MMNALRFQIEAEQIVRRWPRVEAYQNSTLRYTPPVDFPAYWARVNGRPKVIRCWVTLDELWDYRTDTYDWNYRIGINRYLDDPEHHLYDNRNIRPSETRFEDYLKSYTAIGEEAILNIRRYEHELKRGFLPYARYEAMLEKVVAHCVTLCPNIVYIEAGNEPELESFGGLRIEEYLRMYLCVCRVVNRLNERHGWALKVGGTASTGDWMLKNWRAYLTALKNDPSPEKRIDFYSFHDYHPDHNRPMQMYNLHKAAIAGLGLPDCPIFFDEYGTCGPTGLPSDSLKNAAESLCGMLRSADWPGMHVFPWCTFHNPELQLSYTQYVRLPEGGYAPTPNGQAMTMLHGMLDDELVLSGANDINHRARATRGDGALYAIVVNPSDQPLCVDATVAGLSAQCVRVEMREVNDAQNSCVAGTPTRSLEVTETRDVRVREHKASISMTLKPYAFVSWRIEDKQAE